MAAAVATATAVESASTMEATTATAVEPAATTMETAVKSSAAYPAAREGARRCTAKAAKARTARKAATVEATVTVEATTPAAAIEAVEPGTGADEEAVHKPVRSVVAV